MGRKRSSVRRAGAAVVRDDLTRIQGVGATSAERLYHAGIETFEGLAGLTPPRIAEVTRLGVRRIERDDWIGQAAALAELPTAVAGGMDSTDAVRSESENRRESFTLQLLVTPDNHVKRTVIEYVSVDVERTPKQAVDDWVLAPILDFIREHAALDEATLGGAPSPPPDATGADHPGIALTLSARKGVPNPLDPAGCNRRLVCCLEIEITGVTAKDEASASAPLSCLYHIACQALATGDVRVLSSGRIDLGWPSEAGAALSSGPIYLEATDLPVGRSRLAATAMLPDHDLAASTPGPVVIVHE